ncbi:N-acetylmuramoyl-L-alanine amidase [Thiohalorhabdus sp.]|uniref:N-acetylmuramoyl-L-alanine amidase n=1 Tax=Thiohalorhabdus sp. TaxID=3094134 RepID=UPI002FC33543
MASEFGRLKFLGGLVTAVALIVIAPAAAGAAEHTVRDMRMWTAPDHTRLVLDLDSRVEHRLFRLQDPARVVVDLDATRSDADRGNLDLPDPVLKDVRTGYPEQGTFRVVMDLKRDVKPKTFQLEPQEHHGHRLVIDLQRTQNDGRRVTRALEETEASERLVAVDAGHGGEDPGAIGPGGVQEKDVVLEIARRLARKINDRSGMRAFLTRDGDYFLELRERVEKAREAEADLFISLHADAFRNARARGASVYALSRQGATDEAAAWLAKSENQADLAGGVDLDDMERNVASVVLDLSQTATISDSLEVGSHVLDNLGDLTRLHRREVHQAPFVVLKSPDIPSILVETGFISNNAEARRLQRGRYQAQLARAVADGSTSFLEDRGAPSPVARRSGTDKYTVKKGDTLWSIAQRHRVTVDRLKQANDLNGSTLTVGRNLRIP